MSDVQEAALAAMDRGWPVFPLRGKGAGDPKAPVTENGFKDATTDRSRVHSWWGLHPERGIGVPMGDRSGLWLLDLDGPEARSTIRALQKKHGSLPKTIASRTGRDEGGFHLYFQGPDDRTVKSKTRFAPGLDTKGEGGYAVIPPSPHPTGRRYRWVDGRSPDETTAAEAPEWLLDFVIGGTGDESKEYVSASELPDTIPAGQRNDMLTSLAGSMRRRGASQQAMEVALKAENQNRCEPPLDEEEVEEIAASITRYKPSANGSSPPEEDTGPVVLEQITHEVTEEIGRRKTEPVRAVPTPWPAWNNLCMGAGGGEGLASGWHVIIGAPSGAGKSLAATNISAKAIRAGYDVAFISLEMSQAEIVTRLLAIYSGVPIRQLEHGSQFDHDRWRAADEKMQEAPGNIYVNDDPISSLPEIKAAITHHAEEGARLAIVDYLQLAWVKSATSRYDEIVGVSHTIRKLAKKLDITTLGLSQMNRQSTWSDESVKKEGLLGASDLENDADQVVLIGARDDTFDGYKMPMYLDKNRHGPSIEWPVVLERETLAMRQIDEKRDA